MNRLGTGIIGRSNSLSVRANERVNEGELAGGGARERFYSLRRCERVHSPLLQNPSVCITFVLSNARDCCKNVSEKGCQQVASWSVVE